MRIRGSEGFLLLDLFHGEREPAVLEEFLDPLAGLDIKPLDVDHHSSLHARILEEWDDRY